MSLENTLVSNNVSPANQTYNNCGRFGPSLLASSTYSLIESAGNCDGLGTGTGDIFGQEAMLSQLGPHGGFTSTYALLKGSPAIDAGDPAFVGPPFYDQRGEGFSRVVNGRIDIGAYEFPLWIYLPLIFGN